MRQPIFNLKLKKIIRRVGSKEKAKTVEPMTIKKKKGREQTTWVNPVL